MLKSSLKKENTNQFQKDQDRDEDLNIFDNPKESTEKSKSGIEEQSPLRYKAKRRSPRTSSQTDPMVMRAILGQDQDDPYDSINTLGIIKEKALVSKDLPSKKVKKTGWKNLRKQKKNAAQDSAEKTEKTSGNT